MVPRLPRRKEIVACVAVFNVVMIVAFLFSNIYMWDYLKAEINEKGGNKGHGDFVISYIQEMGLQVSIGHEFWFENGTLIHLGTVPAAIPNYPFILLWAYMAGNLVLIAIILRKREYFHKPESVCPIKE